MFPRALWKHVAFCFHVRLFQIISALKNVSIFDILISFSRAICFFATESFEFHVKTKLNDG